MQTYVDIGEIKYNTYKDLPDISSRVVNVVANSIKEDIPRKLYIKGQQISTRHEGQPHGKKCLNCQAYEHISVDCPEAPPKAWSLARTRLELELKVTSLYQHETHKIHKKIQ